MNTTHGWPRHERDRNHEDRAERPSLQSTLPRRSAAGSGAGLRPVYPVNSCATMLIVMATTLVTKTNDSSACLRAVARIADEAKVVSDT